MRQTTLSVVLEVDPASVGRLSGRIEELKRDEETPGAGTTELYGRLKRGVPTLHFISMSVFQGADYDPLLVIEANFDGRPGPFWAQMEETLGEYLRPMLRCCKRPSDHDGPLYDAVTEANSRYPIAPYLERRTLQPSVFHHGNRGLARDRILSEGQLFLATRSELAQSDPAKPNPYRGINAKQIHQRLRAALLPRFPWLDTVAPARIAPLERASDLMRLFGFLLVVLFTLSLPGLLFVVFLRAFFPDWAESFTPLLLLLIATAAASLVLYAKRAARPGEAAPTGFGGLTPRSLSMKNKATSFANPVTLAVTVLIALGLLVGAMAVVGAAAMALVDVGFVPALVQMSQAFDQASSAGFFHACWQALRAFALTLFQGVLSPDAAIQAFAQNWRPAVHLAVAAIYSMFAFSIPAILVWLRWLERRDSHHDAPPIDQGELRKMTRREDRIAQNHMGSVVLVKPGVLRMALFRAGHLGLGLILRVIATDGYLGSMRTVHFAHWAFVNNGSRLMFLSNFDHSWDSYLDDFIEKAHGGLTLAWGSGVGFPATRFLLLDGASHGRQFKAWARHSMAVSRFWFSAYPDYTVNQVERQARIADGLRKATLTSKEATAWAWDL
jgi:hypothetical protein